MVDFGSGEIVPFNDLLSEMLELVDEDARFCDCVDEVRHAQDILSNGTSAHRQLEIYYQAKENNADDREAFAAVVDWLIQETRANLDD